MMFLGGSTGTGFEYFMRSKNYKFLRVAACSSGAIHGQLWLPKKWMRSDLFSVAVSNSKTLTSIIPFKTDGAYRSSFYTWQYKIRTENMNNQVLLYLKTSDTQKIGMFLIFV